MKIKISRRFLIGSLIGVLAMGPFIINLFRKNRTIELPQRNPFHRHYVKERPKNAVRERFFSEWKSLYESFVFRSEKIEQPDTVEVLQDISEPYNYRFRFLTSFANGQCRQLDKCSVVDISYYEIMHGSISIRGYDNPVLTVSIEKNVKKTCRIIQSTIEKKAADQSSTGEYRTYSSSSDPVTSPANPINSVWEIRETPLEIGSFNFVKIGNVFFPSDSKGNVLQEKALTRSEYSFRFSNKLMSHLLYPCPKTVITLGKPFVIENHARWTPSKSIQQACAVSVVLSGDSKVVEFRAKREMDTPEYLNTVRSVLSSLENRLWASNEERNKATNTVNERIKFIEQHGSSKNWEYTCYTNMQNGLTLYCKTSEGETYRPHMSGASESDLCSTITTTLFQCTKHS